MFNFIFKSAFLLLFLCGLVLSPVFAATLPSGYPKLEEFQNLGTVDSITNSGKTIVINDSQYIVPKTVIVIKPGKKSSRLRDVRISSKVGIFYKEGSDSSFPSVTEIWVLPANTKLP